MFRTAKLWEMDLARDALRQATIPHFASQTLSGVETAFEATPMADAGVIFSLYVPRSSVSEAKTILEAFHLDLGQQPGYWDALDPAVVRANTIGARVALWGSIIVIIFLIIRAIISYFK